MGVEDMAARGGGQGIVQWVAADGAFGKDCRRHGWGWARLRRAREGGSLRRVVERFVSAGFSLGCYFFEIEMSDEVSRTDKITLVDSFFFLFKRCG